MTEIPTCTMTGIANKIKKADYVYHGLMTLCILTLENGFLVTGESACAHELKYNKALGEKYAYENAFEKIWLLEGYLLREKLYRESLAA